MLITPQPKKNWKIWTKWTISNPETILSVTDRHWKQWLKNYYIVRMHALGDTYLVSKVTSDTLSWILLIRIMFSLVSVTLSNKVNNLPLAAVKRRRRRLFTWSEFFCTIRHLLQKINIVPFFSKKNWGFKLEWLPKLTRKDKNNTLVKCKNRDFSLRSKPRKQKTNTINYLVKSKFSEVQDTPEITKLV